MLHRWDAMAGSFKGTEIMGYDEADGGYFTRMFDNAGHHPDYRVSVEGQVWNFTEEQTRATVTVQDGRDKISFSWEWKNGGKAWLPLCDRVAVRTQAVVGGIADAQTHDATARAGMAEGLGTWNPDVTLQAFMVAIARAAYDAYVSKDRAAIEALIADDFHFSSPLDNRLDRAAYFARCWPNSKTIQGFEFIHLVRDGDRVFVTYEASGAGGHRFRNTEIVTVRGSQIIEVEVYFGWDVPHKAAVGGFVEDA